MLLLRKILYWLVGLAAVVALAAIIALWAVLGVNPFESDQENLWELTSYEVDFFIRFPGTQVLDDPLVESLENEPGFDALPFYREQLEDFTAEIARQTAGQLPFGQEVNFEADFVGREMAFGASVSDYRQMKVDQFVLLTRVAPYAKFLSALKRGFVRDRIPDADKIELVKGLYLRIQLDPQAKAELDKFRSVKGGMGPRDEIFLARIKDVLIISDNPDWIEHALEGRENVLKADAWFETEFIRTSRGGDAIEAFVRMELAAHGLHTHSREAGTLLHAVENFVPVGMAGELTIRAESRGADQLDFSLSDRPKKDAFANIASHLRKIYDSEKADIRTELGMEGMGRFIPKDDVVGALVLKANPEQLVDILMTMVPKELLELFNEEVRRSSKNRWPDLDRLLRHLTSELGDTHLVVFHRPLIFKEANWREYTEAFDGPDIPKGQMAVSIVSRVKDSVSPAAVTTKLFENMQFLGLESKGKNPQLNFRKAAPTVREEELAIFNPAFGELGGRFFFLSSTVGAAEALHRAKGNDQQRLLSDPRMEELVANLPRNGTFGLILNGPTLYDSIYDGVRDWATQRMGVAGERGRLADMHRSNGVKDEDKIAELVNKQIVLFKEQQYYKLRGQFEEALAPLMVIDGIGMVVNLGVGELKKVTVQGTVLMAPVEGAAPSDETDSESGD